MWTDTDGLHLVTPTEHRRWTVGTDGITAVRHVHTAAHDLDHGVDPLFLNAFGYLEIAAHAGTPETRVDLRDWLSDTDAAINLEISDPLAATGVQAMLDEAGVQVEVRKGAVPTRRPTRMRLTDLLAKGETLKLLAVLVALVLGMVAYVGGPAAVPCGAAAVLISAVVLTTIRVRALRRLRAEHASRWEPTLELRPAQRPGLRRGFVRHARVCLAGDEFVIVDGVGGELWLGRETATGVAFAVRLNRADEPVRVELRRADGTCLARLPWADWFAADEGEALQEFCVAASLPLVDGDWQPGPRDRMTGVSPAIYTFSSEAAGGAARSGWDGADAGVMPAAVPAGPALVTVPVANEGGAGAAVASLALLLIVLAVGPAVIEILWSRWQLRTLR